MGQIAMSLIEPCRRTWIGDDLPGSARTMPGLHAQPKPAGTGRAFENVAKEIRGPRRRGENLFQRTCPVHHSEAPPKFDGRGPVFVRGVAAPPFQESVAPGAHSR